MPSLYANLGLDELRSELLSFSNQVEDLAPDSVLFSAEIRRLAEEIRLLKHKARCWDTLLSHGRSISTGGLNDLFSERLRISSSFKFLQGQLENFHFEQLSAIGPNEPFGNINDTMYSSSNSDKENASVDSETTGYSITSSCSSVSTIGSSSSSSGSVFFPPTPYQGFPEQQKIITSTPLKPHCCRALHFSSPSAVSTISHYSSF